VISNVLVYGVTYAGLDRGLPVVINPNINTLINYTDREYLILAISRGGSTISQWYDVTATIPLALLVDGVQGQINAEKGTVFYLTYGPSNYADGNLNVGWRVHSTLDAALRGEQDIYWGHFYDSTDSVDIQFDILPLIIGR
jgi:hypothetical protein